MSDTNINELILEEIRRNRQELKAAIEAVEVRISMKIEETNHRINQLETEVSNLSNKIEHLEIKQKENNIVIFGLQKTPSQITLELITSQLQSLLNIDLHASDINNFYPLGNKENCPVKLELTSYLKKASIWKNVKKLKGTNITIVNDMTIKQRNENKILRKHLYLAKQDKNNTCYIKRNKLHINQNVYSAEELEHIEYLEDYNPQCQSNSAPETPTTSNSVLNIQPPLDRNLQRNQLELTSHTPTGLKKKKETKEVIAKLGKETIKEDKISTRSKSSKQ